MMMFETLKHVPKTVKRCCVFKDESQSSYDINPQTFHPRMSLWSTNLQGDLSNDQKLGTAIGPDRWVWGLNLFQFGTIHSFPVQLYWNDVALCTSVWLKTQVIPRWKP